MNSKSEQAKRGVWRKDKADRGIFRRGKVYYIRYAGQNGKVRAEAVGTSKALAVKAYAKRKTEVAERRFFPASGILFEELVDDVISQKRKGFKLSHPDKKFKAGNYGIVKFWFAGRRADGILPSEIETKLTSHAKCAATFNRLRVAISHVYKIAIQNKKVQDNPGRMVKMKKENNERVRYLNQVFPKRGCKTEEQRLRQAVIELCPDKQPEIDLALHTGMRWSEQYGLRWQHVDLKRSDIRIVHAKGSGKDEHVPLNSLARTALLRLKKRAGQSEFVCPANDYDKHRDWWLGVLKAAGIVDFHWHDLRHTFASRLVMNGVDIFTVQRLTRHKSIQVTARYAHLSNKHLSDAVGRLVGVTPSDTELAAISTDSSYLQ